MPRQVDHHQRRRDILEAAKNVIAEQGMAALSFREIGRRLGGSTSLITHYYPAQEDVLRDLVDSSVEEYEANLVAIGNEYSDPQARLEHIIFEWWLPIADDDLRDERMRLNVVAAGNQGARVQELLDAWERLLRGVLHGAVTQLVPEDEADHIIDVLRSTLNGIGLSTVEHPDHWTPERQRAVVRTVMSGLGLVPTSRPQPGRSDRTDRDRALRRLQVDDTNPG
ncbi:TetR/AcrR family transcriptional regulator [Kribbella speibonae]|nr:TetR/AcrR family transcriptional regulator [Kribbella speibonae]